MNLRSTLLTLAGGDAMPSAAISKLLSMRTGQGYAEFAVSSFGVDGAIGDSAELQGKWAEYLLGSRSTTIYGGTSEVQLNIIAERLLGLPAIRRTRRSGLRVGRPTLVEAGLAQNKLLITLGLRDHGGAVGVVGELAELDHLRLDAGRSRILGIQILESHRNDALIQPSGRDPVGHKRIGR